MATASDIAGCNDDENGKITLTSLNSLARSPLTDVIMALLFVGPTGSFAWLFGAMAGAAFFLLARSLGTTRPRFD